MRGSLRDQWSNNPDTSRIISKPEDYGLTLTVVYAVWIAAVAALYPLCRWFSQLKQRRSDRWLTYL